MPIQFRPAITTEAKPLIGLYSESGCGKTLSALLLACGFAGGDMSRVGMVETESGRGEAFASHPTVGGYRVASLRQDFSPEAYGQAIAAAEKANLRALIIDSASHEWEGVGGVLSQAAANQEAGKKGPLVWQKPKISHHRDFVLRLLQTPIDLVIVCMRAKYPMKEGKNSKGEKEWQRSEILEPKQADDILFELMAHGWIDQQHRYQPTKTDDTMVGVFLANEAINVETGKRLAAWATSRSVPAPTLTLAQQSQLAAAAKEGGHASADVSTWIRATFGVAAAKEIRRSDFEAAAKRLREKAPLASSASSASNENEKRADGECGCPDSPANRHLDGCSRGAA